MKTHSKPLGHCILSLFLVMSIILSGFHVLQKSEFQAAAEEGYQLHVWISDSPMGECPDEAYYHKGIMYYLCYEVLDLSNGRRISDNITGYTAEEFIYRPDGSVAHSNNYGASSNNWIGRQMDALGVWNGTVKITGSIDIECSVSWDVTAPEVNLHVWVSDSKMGNVPNSLKVGEMYYLCYELTDLHTNKRLNDKITGYSVTEKIMYPNGSTGHEYTYDDSSNNWIGCLNDAAGEWSGLVTVKGDFEVSCKVVWDTELPATAPQTTTSSTKVTTTTTKATTTTTAKSTTTTTKTTTTTTKSTATTSATTTTTTVPTATRPYVHGRDNWSFINSHKNFGYGTYEISSDYLQKLKNELNYKESIRITEKMDRKWGGSCYGMSLTSIIASYRIFNPSEYQTNATYLNQIIGPPTSDVKSLINYYHVLQYTDIVQQMISGAKCQFERSKLANLINCVSDGTPTLLTFTGWDAEGSAFGHAVVAYGVEYGNYSFSGKNYTGKILVYDNNAGGFNNQNCLYFDTYHQNWCIPAYELHSENEVGNGSLSLITKDLNLINYKGYFDGRDYVPVDNYIATMSVNTPDIGYSVHKIKFKDDLWEFNSVQDDDDIIVYAPFSDAHPADELKFAMRDANSGYAVQFSGFENQSIMMDYEDCMLIAKSNYVNQAAFSPDGYAELIGNNQSFSIRYVTNTRKSTDWLEMQISGTKVNEVSISPSREGYVVSANRLHDISADAANRKDRATLTFSSAYPNVLLYEISPQTIGVKVDTNGDGTYETKVDTKLSGKYTTEDLLLVQKHILGNYRLTEKEAEYFDVDHDGTVDVFDLGLMKREVAA